MGQASSARSRGSKNARDCPRRRDTRSRGSNSARDCPRCRDTWLISLIFKKTKYRRKRFSKCPRNDQGPNLFGYYEAWDTSGALKLHNIAELSAGVEMPGIGTKLHFRTSFVSEDWLKASLKEPIMGVSVGLLTTMNHSLAYNMILRKLIDPACMSSNSIQEHLGRRILSSIKYVYKDDQRNSSIRPTCGRAFLSSFEVGNIAPGSKDSWYLRQEVDLRVACPFGVLNSALNVGMAARLIHPLGREHTGSVVPLSERFYLDANRSLVCCLGGPSSLPGFKSKGLEPKYFGTSGSNNSENGASASPELHGGGDIEVTAFIDLSFDLPLKPLTELGIHGHAFIYAGNHAKLTEYARRKLSLTDFLETFKSSVGFGVVVLARLFRIEMNYCYIPKQSDHDRGKAGVQLNFSLN